MQKQLIVLCLAMVTGRDLGSAARVDVVEVMSSGESSSGCKEQPCAYKAFRIPGLVSVDRSVLLAFAEGRKTGCGDFDGQHDLVMKRSLDGGRSWGKLVTLVDAIAFWPNYTANHPPETGNAVWDPTPVYDRDTGRIFVFFNGPGREADIFLCQTWVGWSDDIGLSWHFRNVTSDCQRPGPTPGSRAGNTPTNGHGVQLSSGRLLIPMYGGTPAGGSVCYSDDHGASWSFSVDEFGGAATTEMEVAELNPLRGGENSTRTLYMTIRNDQPVYPEGHRQYSISTDDGLTWSPRLNVQVPDPGNKGGVVQWPEGNGLVLSTAASCVGRVNQTIYISLENGSPGSWMYRQLIHPQSGYSTLQMTDGGSTIANLFEKGGCSIALALVDPKDIIADGPRGYIPCAQSHCGGPRASPPASPPDPHRGYCASPPPPPPRPPSAICQHKLDAFCSSPSENAACVQPTLKSYPNGQPFVARYDLGCAVEPKRPWPHGIPVGPCQQALSTRSWKCYSHLALDSVGEWSNNATHPNAYCSESGALQSILASCN